MRVVLAFLFTCGFIWPQIQAPRLGFVRARDGKIRVLRGVAGNFTVGEPVLEGANECWFDGQRGVARTGDSIVRFNAAGEITGEAGEVPAAAVARIESDEIVIASSGVRLRMAFTPERIERAGKEYVIVMSADRTALVRITQNKEQVYDLPEAAE